MAIQLPYTGVTTSETMPAPYLGAATIQLPYTSTAQTPFSIGSTIDISTKEDKANKGVANGYAPLDATSKVPSGNLPTIDVSGQITTHNSATTSVHGIANTANLVTTSILASHEADSTAVHGITNTAELIHSGSANTDKIVTFDRSVAGFSDSEIADWGFGVEDGTREAYIESTGFVASANLSGKSIRIEAEKFIIDGSHQVAFPNASGTLVLASQAIAFAIALG